MLSSDRTATIHALASGAPPAGIGVVRVSGPLVQRLVTEWIDEPLAPRRARLVTLRGADGSPLDDALALHFPGPRSFTGEDVLELHCHGGPAVLAAVGRRLDEWGARPAEPGEFTFRAHLNGRIDLIEADRLADVIEAETEAQRAFAASGRGRRNAALYRNWRERLIEARALMEAMIDFADEDDAPVDVTSEVGIIASALRDDIDTHLEGERAGEIVRLGYRLVIAGAPNAGKSSLLNALAGRDAAIVTPHAGTTRDVIEVVLDLRGHRVVVSDTAGLRARTDDPVERLGMDRTLERLGEADGVLWLVAPDNLDHDAGQAAPSQVTKARDRLVIGTKADLIDRWTGPNIDGLISVRTGEGMRELLDRLAELVRARVPDRERSVPLAERHVRHLRRALDHLALVAPIEGAGALPPELMAERLRMAADEIGRIGGEIGIEQVYDAIFSRFCMGK